MLTGDENQSFAVAVRLYYSGNIYDEILFSVSQVRIEEAYRK
jgi:hypothetical protein